MAANKAMYTSPERLYLNAAGQVVKADDPSRLTLLVAAGGSIPLAVAQRYGLGDDPPAAAAVVANDGPPNDAPPAAKAVSGPPRTKALRGPESTK